MKYANTDGIRIAYDDRGPPGGVTLLCLPGWCTGRRFFEPLADRLGTHLRVVTLDWRGHGDSDRPAGDFGHGELVSDALAVIEATGAETVVPIAQAHGGWVAMELWRRLGERIPKIFVASWLLLEPPPPFVAVLGALQDREGWRTARDQLFSTWLTAAPSGLAQRVREEMGAYDFDMWARAARAIGGEYTRHGSPLRALSAMTRPPPIRHVFSQPRMPEFLEAQESFAREHAWFTVRRLDAQSQFPTLEIPDVAAADVAAFVG
jgi:pimeloyl-ACP methyl ester carboxylesterase